jgi:hypothetical protein
MIPRWFSLRSLKVTPVIAVVLILKACAPVICLRRCIRYVSVTGFLILFIPSVKSVTFLLLATKIVHYVD